MILKSKTSIVIADKDGAAVVLMSTKAQSFTEASDFIAVRGPAEGILTRREAKALHAWLGKALQA